MIDVAIHPSGKLALSIGKDRKLVTWNLIKGRSAYVTNIKDIPNFVKWSPTGILGSVYCFVVWKIVTTSELAHQSNCITSFPTMTLELEPIL